MMIGVRGGHGLNVSLSIKGMYYYFISHNSINESQL